METYYHPHDLGKFADMGKGNKDLWDKFMSYYSTVFAKGARTRAGEASLLERDAGLLHLAVGE
ncbi:MAG: hypothetical protein HY581_01225 [Nitrospirae bacterium]|nr:hypothetical protein [Nitrospirota bacterium]